MKVYGKELKLGQKWKRKNGVVVELTNERICRGSHEFELTPVSGRGRKSWKWDGGIVSELDFIE